MFYCVYDSIANSSEVFATNKDIVMKGQNTWNAAKIAAAYWGIRLIGRANTYTDGRISAYYGGAGCVVCGDCANLKNKPYIIYKNNIKVGNVNAPLPELALQIYAKRKIDCSISPSAARGYIGQDYYRASLAT